jgi:hypothetical protein
MNTNELQLNLRKFTGTEHYYRITNRHLLTGGTKYLAEEAQCFWLMTAVASHLPNNQDHQFALVKLIVKDRSALLTLNDGNGNLHILACSRIFAFATNLVAENEEN